MNTGSGAHSFLQQDEPIEADKLLSHFMLFIRYEGDGG